MTTTLASTRRTLSLTQEQLGARLGVEQPVVCHYELGRLPVPVDIAQAVSRLAGRTGFPCPKCQHNRVVVEFWDGPCCGACTKPMPEDPAPAPRCRSVARKRPAAPIGPSGDLGGLGAANDMDEVDDG